MLKYTFVILLGIFAYQFIVDSSNTNYNMYLFKPKFIEKQTKVSLFIHLLKCNFVKYFQIHGRYVHMPVLMYTKQCFFFYFLFNLHMFIVYGRFKKKYDTKQNIWSYMRRAVKPRLLCCGFKEWAVKSPEDYTTHNRGGSRTQRFLQRVLFDGRMIQNNGSYTIEWPYKNANAEDHKAEALISHRVTLYNPNIYLI